MVHGAIITDYKSKLTKRLSDGINFQAAYTFSKAIDTTSEATAVGTGDTNQTGNGTRTARGLSRFHTPHRFTLFGTYRLPFFIKRADWIGQILGGWQASMVFQSLAWNTIYRNQWKRGRFEF